PAKFALIGVDLAEGIAESWRDHLYAMLKTFVGNASAEFDIDQIDEAAWKRLGQKMSYIQGDLTKPALYEKIRGALGDAEKSHGTQGNAIFYLAVADRFFGAAAEQLGKAKLTDQGEDKNGKPRFLAPRRDREAVWPQPGLGARTERSHSAHTGRGPDLSDRSLSGKEHGPKHSGVPLRQRTVRADLESRPDRSRADHRGGDGGRGGARQVLRANRCAPGHGAEPRVHAPFDGGHGAADGIRRRFDPQQEGRTVRSDAGRQAGAGGARPVWSRQSPWQEGEGVSGRGERGGGLECRDLCRHEARDRQLALGWRAFLLPYRQAHVATADGDRDPLQAGALYGVPEYRRRYLAAQLAGPEHRSR